MKVFAARLTELNNYLLLFPGSRVSKKIPTEELNRIILNSVPNALEKQAYLRGWDFEGRIYKDTCKIFERMEIAEQVYKGGNAYKNTNREEANHVSHERKRKEGEAYSPTNPEKGCAGKRKKNNAGHPRDWMTYAKTGLVNGPRHST